MKTIEEYATDLVCNGAEHLPTDDLNESGEIADADHEAAMDLAAEMARAVRDHADEVIAWARAVDDPDPEPRFVIHGKDKLAFAAVRAYQVLCYESGLGAQADQVWFALREIEEWQQHHPDLVKLPDHQHVPAAGASS